MTFTYELDPYSVEIYRINENELRTSRLLKVIILRQTDTTDITYHATSRVVSDIHFA